MNFLPQVGPADWDLFCQSRAAKTPNLTSDGVLPLLIRSGLSPNQDGSRALQRGDGLAVAGGDHVLGGQGLLVRVGRVQAGHVHV